MKKVNEYLDVYLTDADYIKLVHIDHNSLEVSLFIESKQELQGANLSYTIRCPFRLMDKKAIVKDFISKHNLTALDGDNKVLASNSSCIHSMALDYFDKLKLIKINIGYGQNITEIKLEYRQRKEVDKNYKLILDNISKLHDNETHLIKK